MLMVVFNTGSRARPRTLLNSMRVVVSQETRASVVMKCQRIVEAMSFSDETGTLFASNFTQYGPSRTYESPSRSNRVSRL